MVAIQNLFKHPTFAPPAANISSTGTVGVITSTKGYLGARTIELRLRVQFRASASAGDLSNQAIIFAVIADPVPDEAISAHDCQGPVAKADADRVYVVIALPLFELKTWMRWICLKDAIGAGPPAASRETSARTASWHATASKQIVQRKSFAFCVLV